MLTYWRCSLFCSLLFITSFKALAHSTVGDRVVRISAFERNLYNYTELELQENFGCRNSLPVGHFAQVNGDAAACPGKWEGHVSGAELCAPAWHVCSSKDKSSVFDGLTEAELFSLPGCYATNAAHRVGSAGCEDCSESGDDKTAMTGMGGGCPYYNRSDHSTCLPGARIDLPEIEMRPGAKCAHKPYLNGVVCCRDSHAIREESPQVVNHGYHVHNLQAGQSVTVECRGQGHPTPPAINWFRDGKSLSSEGNGRLRISNRVEGGNLTVSTLTIARVEMSDHQSQLSCEASSRYGREGGVHHLLKVWESARHGCKKGVEQYLLPGGEVFACKGRWHGHVRTASKHLCGKRYQVCGALGEDTRVLDRADLAIVNRLPGCYALDAATTKREYCDRCNPRHRGNRMLGVGRDCGSVTPGAESCLGRATVQVWPDAGNYSARVLTASERTRRSCNFNSELTTGVLCCRKSISAMFERKPLVCSPRCEGGGRCVAGKSCSCPRWRSGDRCQINLLETHSCTEVCGPHAECNRRKTKCKCSRGYKMQHNRCVAK